MATINIRQKDDLVISLDFDADTTGATAYFMAKYRKSDTDANAAINKNTSSWDDASAGQTTITLTDEEVEAITPTVLYWQTWYVDASGLESSATIGIMNIREDLRD